MKTAVYPGVFDPITYGHIDVIERASTIFDKIVVVVGKNTKKNTIFTSQERLEMAQTALKHIENCEVITHDGLTVEIAKEMNAIAIIRGMRAISDFDYEFQIALINRKLEPKIHTLFMLPNEKFSYLSSSLVRELASFRQDVTSLVPEFIAKKLMDKMEK